MLTALPGGTAMTGKEFLNKLGKQQADDALNRSNHRSSR